MSLIKIVLFALPLLAHGLDFQVQEVPVGRLPETKDFRPIPNAIAPVYIEYDVGNLTGAGVTQADGFVPASVDPLRLKGRALGERTDYPPVQDTRTLIESKAYPWSSVGRLVRSDGIYCTASLVGPRLIATAKHCTENAGPSVTYTFQLNYDNGNVLGNGQVTTIVSLAGPTDGNCRAGYDFAVLVLDTNLGTQWGYFGVQSIDSSLINVPRFYTGGYPGDKGANQMYSQGSITISAQTPDTNPVYCDATTPVWSNMYVIAGQSGSSIWYKTSEDTSSTRYSLGVVSTTILVNNQQIGTAAAGGAGWVKLVNDLRAQYP